MDAGRFRGVERHRSFVSVEIQADLPATNSLFFNADRQALGRQSASESRDDLPVTKRVTGPDDDSCVERGPLH